MRDHIQFYLGDQHYRLSDITPETTVLDWLREACHRTGTKEGCNEGDCGACTVLVVRLENNQLTWKAVNACIQFLWMLDGTQLFTVEDLRSPDGALHPVQQAMVDLHGSQCGFCTPGFVMSMVAYSKKAEASAKETDINDALAGNLCRCTGYAPIVKAMKQALLAPHDKFEQEQSKIITRLTALQNADMAEINTPHGSISLPRTADELASAYQNAPNATLVAGATDVGLWVTKRLQTLPHVISVSGAQDLKKIEHRPDGLWIGAATPYAEAQKDIATLFPDAGEVIRRIGSAQVRNVGTVCGNIGNGSPIGDGPPLFIAAGATLHLRRGETRRTLPLENYFLAYGQQDRQEGEFIEGILIPYPEPNLRYRAYKVSKRFDQDISAILGVFAFTMDGNGVITKARIAFGGMAATPKRASATEAALVGKRWDEHALIAAREAIQVDFAPLSDMRGSEWYRRTVAANLLTRCFAETTKMPQQPETRLAGWKEDVHG
ncbi:xanthine dehydrogenase XdhA [Acetobacter tropicalis NRIC 0312]|uniref:Xanthine dehydrogenase small subunit n=1 Tax=Acetobacter tropicalis TaxID=104102 RepID=A0A511FRB2_9PROT|nr:xanthine dehydrogenase small subunit [Acetobacter tropicalis]KXV50790.1 FAD-binding molybdopterin dehydrogenase [Acetobacter tropicalis]GAL98924.1 FAD-binding molybdopterin dehydrogenase [Acetobacter tropicalis]GBR69546.1 xanthine dehydrogenase XdhA [Acetobacter tropicalis NRIC 0312]GEL51479.1 xanthine dehydrogenase small subunit [Acetobacter tropicalis]